MTEHIRVRATGLLKCIRQDSEPSTVQSARRQVSLVVGGLGEPNSCGVVLGEDGGGYGDAAEGVAEKCHC
jgi:hypothetical protein